MSRKPTGPGRGGDAVEIVSIAMVFQSTAASARATGSEPSAANAMRGAVANAVMIHRLDPVRAIRTSLFGRTARRCTMFGGNRRLHPQGMTTTSASSRLKRANLVAIAAEALAPSFYLSDTFSMV